MNSLLRYITIIVALFCASVSYGQLTTTLNAVDQGNYHYYPGHSSWTAQNDSQYIVGFDNNGSNDSYYRNYFVFDLSGLVANRVIYSATLKLELPNNSSAYVGDATETFSLYKVATAVNTVSDPHPDTGSGLVPIYNDLGDGTIFGTTTLSESNTGHTVSITLNNDFLTYANANHTKIILGGALTSINPNGGDQYVFFNTSDCDDVQLQFVSGFPQTNPVPEPSTYGLIGAAGLLSLIGYRRYTKMRA